MTVARAHGRGLKGNPHLDPAMRDRHQAALKLVDRGDIDPVLALSLVVWPPDAEDDPSMGTLAVDRRRQAAA
jgi:hypothetical protein